MLEKLIWLIYAHAIGDMALQGPWIATYKSFKNPLIHDGNPVTYYWLFVLTAHALINGACVSFVSKNVWYGLFIVATHWAIDLASTSGMNFVFDQGLHFAALVIVCKLWNNQITLANKL